MAYKDKKPKERVTELEAVFRRANDTYNSSDIDPDEWKKFYLGSNHWDTISPEGELKVVIPLPAICLDQHVFLFTNKTPKVNFKAPSASPFDRVKAQVAEDLIHTALYDSKWASLFQDATMTMAQMAEVYLYPNWDVEDKKRSPQGTAKLDFLSPTTTRIVYGRGYRFKPSGFIFWERYDPAEIASLWGVKNIPTDGSYEYTGTLNLSLVDKEKATVFTYIDDEIYSIYAGGKELKYGEHNYGFVPISQLKQIFVPDSVGSLPLMYHIDAIQQQLNLLFSAALELALDLAYPPMLEYNNALGGKKIRKWRRRKIKVRRSDKGESLSYLAPVGNPAILLEQIRSLIDLTYLIMQMPPAAMGVVKTQVTSGFQAQVYQQPASTKQASWGVQWTIGLQDACTKLLQLIAKKDPEALNLTLDSGEKVKLEGLDKYEISIDFGERTPIDEVRKTQMMMLRLQNNLISVYQALEELGDDNPYDTMAIMKEEATDPALFPEKAMKVAKARQVVQQLLGQTMGGIKAMGGGVEASPELMQRLPPEMQEQMTMENETNALRGLGGRREEERRGYPAGGRERVAEASVGEGGLPLPE